MILVGDVPVEKESAGSLVTVPTHYVPSQVIARFGGEKIIAGDNWYADLDDDQLPDIAIGRLPADSAADLRTMVDKIVAYERGPAPGNRRRRINLVAGLGGFGAFADAAIEASAKRLLIDGIPAAYATSVTYGSWRSPYCPDPQLFHASTVDRFNEGCLFWVYMGHGHTRTVDRVARPTASITSSTPAIARSCNAEPGRRSHCCSVAAPAASTSAKIAWPKNYCEPRRARSRRWPARA